MYTPSTDGKYLGSSPNSPGTEPMSLGSPVSSPTNHSSSIGFLPSYLIRDIPSTSPSFNQQSVGWTTPVKHSSPFMPSQLSPGLSRKSLYQSSASSSLIGSPNVTKAGGPPVQSLFDSVVSPMSSHGTDFSKMDHTPKLHHQSINESQLYNGVLTPTKTFSHNNSICLSPAQIDPFYTQGEALTSGSQLDETWVTVFGFPPAATNFILQQFSQYGKIIEHKLATTGNWVHIRYQSKLQAKKALSKSGKIYGDNIMVGVKPCIEMNVMTELGKENSEKDTSVNLCQETINVELFDSSKRSLKNIRPLTQIYKTPTSETEVTPKTKVQPKTNSIVSKAMEYVLKW